MGTQLLPLLAGCSSGLVAPASDAQSGPTIYATMYGDNEVSVIDATGAVTGHIPVGSGPAIILATPDNKKLYTANWAATDNSLSSVDVATRAVTRIALDSRPWVEAMSPDGMFIYAGLNSGEIVTISTATDQKVNSFTTNGVPESVIVSADGNSLYVALTQTNSLTGLTSPGTVEAISAMTGNVVHPSITVGHQPAWISISPDGAELYALNFLDGTVSVVDTVTWTVKATVSTGSGSQPIIGTSTPKSLLVTNFNAANVVVIDSATNGVTHTLKTDGRAVGVASASTDGTLAYVSDLGHASLAVSETLALTLQISMGDLSGFIGGPGHVTAFNPLTGQAVGASITVGHGPTSLVVLPP